MNTAATGPNRCATDDGETGRHASPGTRDPSRSSDRQVYVSEGLESLGRSTPSTGRIGLLEEKVVEVMSRLDTADEHRRKLRAGIEDSELRSQRNTDQAVYGQESRRRQGILSSVQQRFWAVRLFVIGVMLQGVGTVLVSLA